MMVVIRRGGERLLLEGKATGVDAHAEVVHELSFARVSVNHTCLAVIHGIGQIDVAVIGIHVKTIKLVASSLTVFGQMPVRSGAFGERSDGGEDEGSSYPQITNHQNHFWVTE